MFKFLKNIMNKKENPLTYDEYSLHRILNTDIKSEPNSKQDEIIFGCGCFWGGNIIIRRNTIQFLNYNQLPDGMSEEDAKKLVSAVNSQIVVLKAYLTENSTGDNQLSMIFEYNHIVLNNETISPKTIVQIARFVEKAITATYPIYQELFLKA